MENIYSDFVNNWSAMQIQEISLIIAIITWTQWKINYDEISRDSPSIEGGYHHDLAH